MSMRLLRKHWRGIAATGGILVVVLVVVGLWVVPWVITSAAGSATGGRVSIGGWWVGFGSAGVTGIRLHEGQEADSPVWLSAETVSTDLSLGALLHGRFGPRRVTIEEPEILIRLDEENRILTRFPGASSSEEGSETPAALPSVEVVNGSVTFDQTGRPRMTVDRLHARLLPDRGGFSQLDASSSGREWGRLSARGRFGPGFESFSLTLKSAGLDVTPGKAKSLPFVPPATWEHVEPTGPLKVSLSIRKAARGGLSVLTMVSFVRTELDLPSLGLHARDASGLMKIDGSGLVTLEEVRGDAIGGQVEANGRLDFGQSPPRIDLSLALEGIDVAQAPASWQLDEAGLTGRLTGKTHLLVVLDPKGADLTGSTGDAQLSGGTLQGIPVKSLTLQMSAEGQDLHYESDSPSASAPASSGELQGRGPVDLMRMGGAGLLSGLDISKFFGLGADAPRSPGGGRSGALPGERGVTPLVAADPEPGPEKAADEETKPRGGGLVLPKALSTEVEFEDVDLAQIVAKAKNFGIHLPFQLAGKLSVKARATIPLGAFRDVKAYAFHGSARLKQAHIAGIDIGHAEAHLDLEDGFLDLSRFAGRLVDRPKGHMLNPAPDTGPIPDEGPLPPGGFRARVRARLSPAGALSATVEARDLPLGELAAPYLPRPTPLSGLVNLDIAVAGDLAHATESSAWTASGTIDSHEIVFETARLDSVSTKFQVENARLELSKLSATLDGRPLQGSGRLDLKAPYGYSAVLDVSGWDLAHLLALVPSAPRPSPVSGSVSAEAKAEGSLSPFQVETSGSGTLGDLVATGVSLGTVPFRWSTGAEAVEMSIVDAHPLGGKFSADILLPLDDREIAGSSRFEDLDARLIDGAFPQYDIGLSGRASGHVSFLYRTSPPEGEPPIEFDARVDSKLLSVRELPIRAIHGVASLEGDVLKYDLYAEALEGKIQVKGSLPVGPEPARPLPEVAKAEPNGRLRAIGFRLEDALWSALGVGGVLGRLEGEGAVDANLRLSAEPLDVRARGLAEFRDLRLRAGGPIGRLKGEFLVSPERWGIDNVTGELFGGSVGGSLSYVPASGDEPSRLSYRAEITSADVGRLALLAPPLAGVLSGRANVRATGRLDEAFRARGELRLPVGRFYGLPMSELEAPVELTYLSSSGIGSVEARRFHARLAGGRLDGTARVRFGLHRNFSADLKLTQLDLGLLTRGALDSKRPASGKVSGTVDLKGLDAYRLETYSGRADLRLIDASVLDLPVFRVLDRFLGGAAGGGVFEQGELHALVSNRQIIVEQLALFGRVAQLHGEGKVGFDGQVDLVVLVNTNQMIPETGEALVALIPGLRNARGSVASLQVANYLSNKLLKLRVSGSVWSPVVTVDPSATVSNAAVGFFSGVLKLPLGLLK
jgi:translocation and assembly module TamB